MCIRDSSNVINILIVPQQTPLFIVILLAAGGFFMFVCMDSTAKYLGTVMPVTQAIWGRFFFQAEDGIRDLVRSRGLGDVYKRQVPRYFAVESMQTNIKKPPAANKITLNKGVCWGTMRCLLHYHAYLPRIKFFVTVAVDLTF